MLSGVECNLTHEAANHILGYRPGIDVSVNGPVFKHVTKRWGWNTNELNRDKLPEKWFLQLKIKPVAMKMVEIEFQSEGEDATDTPEIPKMRQGPHSVA